MDVTEGRLLFRSLTNEQDTMVLPDTGDGAGDQAVDTYLQRGLEEFSRQVGGYLIEENGDLSLGTTGQVALPTDFVDVLWVRAAGGSYLKRTTYEELLANKVNWDSTAGAPTDYLVVGTNLQCSPKLGSGTLGLTVKYVAAPGAYDTAAFTGIAEQDHALPVYYAAALFIQLHNDVPEMQARAANLLALFYKGCEGARPFYERKRMPGRRAP